VKYVLLSYPFEKQLEALAPAARIEFEEACRASEQELIRSGHLYALEDLPKDSPATTVVQVLDGELYFTDSSFLEAKGLSVRLFFIRARDLNTAIQIAARMPQARQGLIEVRTIVEFESGKLR
jgi:hypothetical protein